MIFIMSRLYFMTICAITADTRFQEVVIFTLDLYLGF